MDIRTNDGNMKETHGSLTVGVLNDRFHLEGPIVKDKLSYSLSARGLHTIIAEPFMRLLLKDEYYNYFFYDLNGKLTWRATDKDRFYLSVYHGADDGAATRHERDEATYYDENGDIVSRTYEEDDSGGLSWGSTVGALRWNHIFNGRLFANFTLHVNQYRMKMDVCEDETTYFFNTKNHYYLKGSYKSGIRDFGFRTDFDWTPSPSHLVKFGAEYTRHDFLPQTLAFIGIDNASEMPYKGIHYKGNDTSCYIEDNISLGDRLSFNPGLRFSWFNTQGKNYFSLQPRLSAKFSLDGNMIFKAGYSRMAQYVHLLTSTIIALPLDLWVPITKDIKPVTADHYSLGAYYDGLPGWEFSVEGYWKEMYNLMEYKEGVQLVLSNEGWEDQVETGRGRATGLEFFIQKTSGKTTGWVAYTLARSERWFPDGSINMGRHFPYKYDRTHSFNLTLNHKFSKKVDVSLSWVFSSGSTMTLPERTTAVIEPGWGGHPGPTIQKSYYVAGRNNYRLPPSHRLNLGINLRHRTRRGNEAVWNLSVYNAYNAMNPNFVFYSNNSEYDPEKGEAYGMIGVEKLTILPIIPAFSYTYNF